MLDKTKNLFTCYVHGDKEAIRLPVCHHVRAWVKKEMHESYALGYKNGQQAGRYDAKDKVKKLKPETSNYDRIQNLFIDNEKDIFIHGYECAKEDILGGLE